MVPNDVIKTIKKLPITTSMKANLFRAIARATIPGQCRYSVGDRPGCFIGQLAVLEGVTVTDLHKWDGVMDGLSASVRYLRRFEPELTKDTMWPLEKYFSDELGDLENQLLVRLQAIWDCNLTFEYDTTPQKRAESAPERRKEMVALIEENTTTIPCHTLSELMELVEAQAELDGPEAVAELEAYRTFFRNEANKIRRKNMAKLPDIDVDESGDVTVADVKRVFGKKD